MVIYQLTNIHMVIYQLIKADVFFLSFKAPKIIIVVFANSVTPDKAAYDEPVYLHLHCSHCLSILRAGPCSAIGRAPDS